MQRLYPTIATTRFSMGARTGEIAAAASDPRGWLQQQINPEAARIEDNTLRSAQESMRDELLFRASARKNRKNRKNEMTGEAETQRQAMRKSYNQQRRQFYTAEIAARNRHAVATKAGFAERWVRFWSNHFTVSTRNPKATALAGPFEREAIRANAFTSFRTLLHAATLHQGMLVYLDNVQSVGPSSRIAKKRDRGLNENLAREVLELHTLGVDGGYGQEDVLAFAKVLTGWAVASPSLGPSLGPNLGPASRGAREADVGKVVFTQRVHEPGSKTILGKRYKEDGANEAISVLDDLSVHPSTARHIATKLARHFIADEPPGTAIEALSREFSRTGGDLKSLALKLISLDEAWDTPFTKFKTPEELLISSARTLGMRSVFGTGGRAVYRSFDQQPFRAPSPEGWPDTAGEWLGADAVMKRIEWANRVARRVASETKTTDFLEQALGPVVSAETRQAVLRAESNQQAMTLALMSPEFQRR